MRALFRPCGALGIDGPTVPTVETVGYCRPSQRDFLASCQRPALPGGGLRTPGARRARPRRSCGRIRHSPPARGQAWANSMRARRCGVTGLLPTASNFVWGRHPVAPCVGPRYHLVAARSPSPFACGAIADGSGRTPAPGGRSWARVLAQRRYSRTVSRGRLTYRSRPVRRPPAHPSAFS